LSKINTQSFSGPLVGGVNLRTPPREISFLTRVAAPVREMATPLLPLE
jgi:hypothetical protein